MAKNTKNLIIIAIGIVALYIILKEEAQAAAAINLFPSTLPKPTPINLLSRQIVINTSLDH